MLQPGHPHPDPQQHLEGLLSPAALPLQQELLELFDTAAVCCVFEEQHELSLALVISIAFCVHLQAIVCVWGGVCVGGAVSGLSVSGVDPDAKKEPDQVCTRALVPFILPAPVGAGLPPAGSSIRTTATLAFSR